MSLQRAFERRRRYEAGLDNNPHPKVLDEYNERLGRLTNKISKSEQIGEGSYLHSRKGYRTVSPKRGRAAMITMEQKRGQTLPTIFALASIRMFILTGRYK